MRRKVKRFNLKVFEVVLVALLAGCCTLSDDEKVGIRAAVGEVLEKQVAAWNAGSIDAFMTTYWASEKLRFASGGSVKHGWDATRERYRITYPDQEAMGEVTFDVHAVDVLAADAALVFGEWKLTRTADELSGLYTLIVRKIDGRWLIVHDHTSRAP